MRSTRNFNPEWGYLAPSGNFIRTARVALIAVVAGGIAGAVIVLPLIERPVGENSVAARTLSQSGEGAAVPVGTPRAEVKMQAVIPDQPTKPTATERSRTANESSAGASAQLPASGAVGAEVPAASTTAPAKARPYQARVADEAPLQKKVTRKRHPSFRYASRGEHLNGDRGPRRPFENQALFGANLPAEYYPQRGYGGYYREQRWGDNYLNGGFDFR
jgi:hypothetical protein